MNLHIYTAKPLLVEFFFWYCILYVCVYMYIIVYYPYYPYYPYHHIMHIIPINPYYPYYSYHPYYLGIWETRPGSRRAQKSYGIWESRKQILHTYIHMCIGVDFVYVVAEASIRKWSATTRAPQSWQAVGEQWHSRVYQLFILWRAHGGFFLTLRPAKLSLTYDFKSHQ